MNLDLALKTTRSLALSAGKALKDLQPRAKQIRQSRKDFVTQADYLAEGIILPGLKDQFPEIEIYSEEAGGKLKRSGWQWIIDPMDGSWMYYKQWKAWGVSSALVHNGLTQLGVVHLPARGVIFTALADGSLKGPTKLSQESDLKESLVLADWTKPDYPDVTLRVLAKLARGTRYPGILVSCTDSMMKVAMGKADGYVCPAPAPEDHAAAGLIVQQAGGRVTDMEGKAWTPFSKSLVASNGILHDSLLELLN